MRDTARFGAETTASEVAEGIDLSGQLALVTGGSGGLGQETARVLAERGAHVILTARDMSKGEAVAAGIRASTGNQHVEVEELELGSLKHIRAFAQRFLARHPTLHILVNNAGVMACPPAKTANVLFAVGLERRLGARGVHANALHPGGIMTELSRHLQPEDMQFLQARTRGMKFKSVEAGAATSVFSATAPELEGRGGLYLEDCHVAAVNDAPDALDGVKSYALDPQSAERLWEVSEKLVGERFTLRP